MKSKKTYTLVLLSLFIALEVIFLLTPLGFILIGPIRATTLHIPVILAGVLLGKKEGATVGFVFGLCSLIINTLQPTATSFIFSPFITIANVSGNFSSLLIVFVPRILLGFMSGLLYELLKNKISNKNILLSTVAISNTFLHTVLVLGGIIIFFKEPYALANNISADLVFMLILGIIATNGIAEAILAACSTVVVARLLLPISKGGDKL